MADDTVAPVFWRVVSDGVTVAVKVQPRARRPGVQGLAPSADGPRLRIAVTEAPEDGKASKAACACLAKALMVAHGSVQLLAGAASREKLLLVTGDPAVLVQRLRSLGASGRDG